MSNKNINGSFQTFVSDGEPLLDGPQRSSPTLRAAAYHSDIELVGTQPRVYRDDEAVRDYAQKQPEVEKTETPVAEESQKQEWVSLSEVEGRYVAQVLTHTR